MADIGNASAQLVNYLKNEQGKEELALLKDDGLRKRIDDLFTDRIGEPPESQTWLNGIYKESSERRQFRIPPAFMDKSKTGVYGWRGMKFEREHGDLVLWRQIINHVKSTSTKNVVFVTDDAKEDWWEIVKGKTFGPRPELKTEFLALTEASNFLMYNSVNFITHANRNFDTGMKDAAIEKIREAIRSAQAVKYEFRAIGPEKADFDLNMEVSSEGEFNVEVVASDPQQEFVFYYQVWSPLGFYWAGFTNKERGYVTDREHTSTIKKNDIGRYYIGGNIADEVEKRFPALQGQAYRIVRLRGRGDATNLAPIVFAVVIKP